MLRRASRFHAGGHGRDWDEGALPPADRGGMCGPPIIFALCATLCGTRASLVTRSWSNMRLARLRLLRIPTAERACGGGRRRTVLVLRRNAAPRCNAAAVPTEQRISSTHARSATQRRLRPGPYDTAGRGCRHHSATWQYLRGAVATRGGSGMARRTAPRTSPQTNTFGIGFTRTIVRTSTRYHGTG
jgi:hypothetical protein